MKLCLSVFFHYPLLSPPCLSHLQTAPDQGPVASISVPALPDSGFPACWPLLHNSNILLVFFPPLCLLLKVLEFPAPFSTRSLQMTSSSSVDFKCQIYIQWFPNIYLQIQSFQLQVLIVSLSFALQNLRHF